MEKEEAFGLPFIWHTAAEPTSWLRYPGAAAPGSGYGANTMAMYVYSTEGEPVGFVFETNIYDCDGTPLGRIVGCRVHRFDGTYVGEWFRDMVVRRPQGRPRMIPPVPVPPRRPPAGASYKLRAVVDYGYPDAFPQLREGADQDYLSQAAE